MGESEVEHQLEVDGPIRSRRGEEPPGECGGFAEYGRLEHADGLGQVDRVKHVARHGGEGQGIAAWHGLVEARGAVSAAQSGWPQPASGRSATAGAAAGRRTAGPASGT